MNKQNIVICDIDGTIALRGDRSPFDWNRVNEDSVNEPIKQLLRCVYYNENPFGDYQSRKKVSIFFMSGRDTVCRKETEDWLDKNVGLPYTLFMRERQNNEKDSVIKKQIFDTFIKDKYNVLFVLDDRNQTVDMWRSLGLTCLQVAPGDF